MSFASGTIFTFRRGQVRACDRTIRCGKFLDGARYAVCGRELALCDTTYPADAAVPTTLVLTRTPRIRRQSWRHVHADRSK